MFSSFVTGIDITQRFKDAALNLDKTYHTLTDEFDYWPECGIRVTGSHLASLISLTDLQQMLPYPLYVSGPHHDGQWDLDNEDEYGHYNPQAIQYLAGLAKTVVSDELFVEQSRALVDEYLYRQMHIMMVMHDALYNELTQEEREVVFRSSLETKGNDYENGGSGFSLGRLNLEDGTYVYGNVNYRFLHFWARRCLPAGVVLGVEDGILVVAHLGLGEPERLLDLHHGLGLLIWPPVGAPHHERAGGDQTEGHRLPFAQYDRLRGDWRHLVDAPELEL